MCQNPRRGGGLGQAKFLEVFHCVSAETVKVEVSFDEAVSLSSLMLLTLSRSPRKS